MVFFWGLTMIGRAAGRVDTRPDLRPESQTQKMTSAKIISNPKMPRPPDGKSLTMVFTEDLSIGVREGDENYQFGNIIYVNTDQDGNFYVTDWDRKTIRKFDIQGKHIINIGRPGQGPGEFENVWRPEFDQEGYFHVLDANSYRISFFDPSGIFIRQIKLPPELSLTLITRRGFFIGEQSVIEADLSGTATIYGLFDDRFKSVAEFKKTTWKRMSPAGSGEERMINIVARMLSNNAFKPSPVYLLGSDDFIWFGDPETYEIRIYAPDGRLDRIIRRDFDPRPVTAKDKERYCTMDAEPLLNRPRLRGLKSKIYSRIQYPKFKAAYSTIALMENGGLAVIVETADDGDTVFDLFDKDGRYITHFQAPIPSEGLFFKNGKAYAVKTEDGYKFVKRYRIDIK